MEKETFNKEDRYKESNLYKNLQEYKNYPPECIEMFLSSLQKITYASDEEGLLNVIDVLTGFVVLNKDLEDKIKTTIIDKTVDEILPVLNEKNPQNIRILIADEYGIILENFEEIKKSSEPEIGSKCLFACAVLTFPGSKIGKQTDLDS